MSCFSFFMIVLSFVLIYVRVLEFIDSLDEANGN